MLCYTQSQILWSLLNSRGGGGGCESMDGQRCAYFALQLVPQNLIFKYMTPYQKIYFTKFYACHFSKENWSGLLFLYLMNDFYAIVLIFS